jgi:cytochrome c553
MTTNMTTKTKSKFGAAMFESIKEALNKSSSSSSEGQFKDIMKFPAGHTYTVRLLPNLKDPSKLTFHHWTHGWNSKATGKYMSYIGLQTFGERDPISELRWKQWKAWKEKNPNVPNKEYKGDIDQSEKWLFNIYVIDDPSNPENNGKVKILRIGPQIKKLIDDATEGDRADELGFNIFDPTAGHDLKIKAESKGEYTTFESSFFTTKSKTSIDEDEAEEICSRCHDLEQIYQVKTYDELQEILNEHYFNVGVQEERKSLENHKQSSKRPVVEDDAENDDDDDIPMFHGKSENVKDSENSDSVEDFDSLLAELDND